MADFDTIRDFLDEQRDTVIDLQRSLVSIPALGPDNDGDGEWDKADVLIGYLKEMGVSDILEFHAPDERVKKGSRPNLGIILPGKDTSKTLWTIGHMDIVPAGDQSKWDTDPFELTVDGDYLIGRGVEDNHQGIISSLLVLKAIKELDLTPDINYGILLVSDEETGSKYGLDYVVKEHKDRFKPEDLFLVPDFGVPTSDIIEVAEKSMLWLKCTVNGKQCHGSTPGEGTNSLLAASALILRLRDLYRRFDASNPLFHPPVSTFEATKKEANVPNINTIPGQDIFYMDCRILPEYDPQKVVETIRETAGSVAEEYGVTIHVETVLENLSAPSTPSDSEIVVKLTKAVKDVYDADASPVGIGGGTVAAFLREQGFHAVVWETVLSNPHQPNERSFIPFTIKDAQVISHLLFT